MNEFDSNFSLSIDVVVKTYDFQINEKNEVEQTSDMDHHSFVAILFDEVEEQIVSTFAVKTYEEAKQALTDWYNLWLETEDRDDFLDNFTTN